MKPKKVDSGIGMKPKKVDSGIGMKFRIG